MSYSVGNYSVRNRSQYNFLSGSNAVTSGNRRDISFDRSLFIFEDDRTSFPRGYGGGSVIPPIKAGGFSSRFITASSDASGELVIGIPLDSALSANGTATATLALIVNLEAALTASGLITDATLAIIAQMTASISASGSVTSADLGNILNMTAALTASGTMTTTDLITLINMSADISSVTELSPEGLAASVMGSEIETGFTLQEALRIILSSVGGKLSGAGTSTITIRNVVDDKDRIVATVDSNGNRTSITYDVGD